MSKYAILNTPYQIAGLTVPNRYTVAPVTTGTAYDENGEFSDSYAYYFGLRAKGGFGLIIPGAVATDYQVDPYSALGPAPLQNPEGFLRGGRKLVSAVHENGGKILCQLSLGLGRNYPGLPAPSEDIVYGTEDTLSPALTVEQIKLKIAQLIDSAKLAQEAGFDGIEVHAMHWGYLLDQFGMSFFNHRTDEYGGPLENRLRAAREIVEGIHAACGRDYPVGMRLSLKAYIKDVNKATLTGEGEVGRDLDEGVETARLLERFGYDFLDVDTGTYDSFYYACPPMYLPQSFMIALAEQAQKAVKIPVIAGGRMQDYDAALEAVETGKITAVALGRPSLADPEYPNKVYAGTPEKIRPCIGCNLGCFNRLMAEGAHASCAVNPAACRELTWALKPGEGKKKVLIIGGGVGGMEAARTAALRGYEATLIEKSDHLGGHLVEAGAHKFKVEVARLNQWYQRELKDLGVKVELNKELSAEEIKAFGADAVILATGSVASAPAIPGLEKAVVSLDAIDHPEKIGRKVIVVGGGLVGCEIALDEAMNGKDVTVVEALDKILSSGIPAPTPNAQMIGDLFEHHGVKVLTGHKLVEVTDSGVVLENANGQVALEADTVISALGFKPRASLKDQLAGLPVYEIGDAVQAKTILNAIWTGYETANSI